MALPTYDWTALTPAARVALLRRPRADTRRELDREVASIIAAVRARGDAAIAEFTRRFDGREPAALTVAAAEFEAAESALPAAAGHALDRAIANVRRFHEP